MFAVTCKSRKPGGYWDELNFGSCRMEHLEVAPQCDNLLLHRGGGGGEGSQPNFLQESVCDTKTSSSSKVPSLLC